ncbi:HupU protein [uncultured Cohaesibacter sp.]|uniref:NADH-quinone oxidoreductase subunit B family protein n=1 Tax=uncultured Cohaesibacter sp. TaxID=1002546 RepID=UPI003748482A
MNEMTHPVVQQDADHKQDQTRRQKLLWLQSGGCGGCTLSLLCAEGPDLVTAFEAAGIELLWHPSLSLESGAELHSLLDAIRSGEQSLDILCLEGSVMQGPNGSGLFHVMAGSGGTPMRDVIREFSHYAKQVVAVGNCAAFGGVTAACENDVEACGLSFDGSRPGGLLGGAHVCDSGLPVITIPGCPTHPDWITESLAHYSSGSMTAADLDIFGRPLALSGALVHHGCSRNEFYEYKASAEKLSELGCMMENLGCKGTQASGDCNIRPWNGSGSCITGGYPCIACTEPEFEEPGHAFTETPKVAGIPIGLPTDMPKAWFVALASLSKAATPKRLSENATAERVQFTHNKVPVHKLAKHRPKDGGA